MTQEDLFINSELTIPASELEWRFTTPGGPGGQHANRNATRVELAWSVAASPLLSESQRRKLVDSLGTRVEVVAADTRSQWRNRRAARRRLIDKIQAALREAPPRVPTRPTRESRKRRIEDKRRRSQTKRLRRPPEID